MLRHNAVVLACSVALVASTAGCLDLLKKKAVAEDAGAAIAVGADAAPPAALPPAPAVASVQLTDGVAPSTEPTPEELKLPGACIDTRADAQRRARSVMDNASVEADASIDLDGDGKTDRIFTAIIQGHVFGWAYVMRGSCGHLVAELPPSDGYKALTSKSHGLRFLEVADSDHTCAGQCDCAAHTTPLLFNGAKYVAGKSKDTTRRCDAGTKRALVKCSAGQSLFAEGEGAPPFCGKSCGSDADCRPGRCDATGFLVDETTGAVFTGVGKSVAVCGKPGASAPAATALAVPPGAPAVLANPKGLECPAGYTKLVGMKTCNKSCVVERCPKGTTCQAPMSFCM
jgi:hypothetical protein